MSRGSLHPSCPICGKLQRRYDHSAIVKDYEKGLSTFKLEKKYGIVPHHAREILVAHGVKMRPSGMKEWRKLTPMGRTQTRIFSLPSTIIKKLGLDPSGELYGKWEINANGELVLKIMAKTQMPDRRL